MNNVKLPVGISDFHKLRQNEYYYVDKTDTLDTAYDFKCLLNGDYVCNLKNKNITRYVKFNNLKSIKKSEPEIENRKLSLKKYTKLLERKEKLYNELEDYDRD